MKNQIITGLGLLLLILALVACQSEEIQSSSAVEQKIEETDTDREHDHSESAENNNGEVPEEVIIEGIADHYHTGDALELTAVLEKGAESDHWHWYSRESSSEEWEIVSGQETANFTGEATSDGTEIKAVLFGDDHEPAVQSAPVKVVIDDHHGHDEETKQIYNGYFEDSQVKERELSDWDGDWQSVYPYLVSGELDEVFAHKAETGDMTEEEYKEYYTEGYVTDVDRVLIEEGTVTFFDGKEEYSGEYASDGYEILTYERGNRGVRFIFERTSGSEQAPQYIQFSDHNIFPINSHHFHLYWGDDREELLKEVTHWPTYYPADLNADGLVRDMLAH
ncbi:ZinT/AdcA family metal-binding protein [Psychrobacillus sp. FSL K6-2836]|uniref:ZinT family metal-binding protein n=1 Tax=Psychrobacillus sp. FSL K6-2836 TaxID=2921548 RepID=UPI0030FAA01F